MATLLKEALPLGLAEAKSCVDQVLNGEAVVLDVDDPARARELALQLEDLGAVVDVRA